MRALKELGLYELLEKRSRYIQAIAVNHDPIAIRSHTANHPTVEHWDCDIETLDPAVALRDPVTGLLRAITILWQSAPCQDWSVAAAGPVKTPHKRATPEYMLKWVRVGRPKVIIEENVFEVVQRWPGWPAHVAELEAEGYRVEYRKLNAADYGTPQSRERLILIAVRDDLPIAWPKQTHSEVGSDGKPKVPGTKPWNGADTILDLDLPLPSIFDRTKWSCKSKKHRRRIPWPHSATTRRRIGRHIRKQGPFWDILARAVEEFTGRVPLVDALAAVPPEQWPDWIVPHGDHIHLLPPDAFVQKHYGNGTLKPLIAPLGSETAQGGHFSLVQPAIFGSGGPTGQQEPRDADSPLYSVLTERHLCLADTRFTLGQQGGAVPHPAESPVATETTDGYIRVGEIRCTLDVGFGSDQGEWKRSKDLPDPLGAVPTSNRFALAEARCILPSRGRKGGLDSNPARPSARELPSVLAEKQTGHVVEQRLLAAPGVVLPHHGERKAKKPGQKDQLPRIHPTEKPLPTEPATRGFEVAFLFIYTQNGQANVRASEDPNTSITTVQRHSYWVVGLRDLFLDVGMRMLTILELARGQDFPDDYVFLGTQADQMRLIGNAVPVLLACAVTKAVLLAQGVISPRIWDFAGPAEEAAVSGIS